MHGHQAATAVLAGLAGFLLGGLVAERLTQVAQTLIAFGSLGAILGAAVGAVTERDVATAAAVGGGVGVGVGVGVVVLDALVGA
jgi:hypothetical protein